MMRKLLVTATLLPLLTFPGVASADTSFGIRAGTLGAGAELSYALSQRVAVRLDADGYNRKQTSTRDSIDYDMKLKLQTVSLLADWFPFANNFRISAGPVYNGNKVALSTPNTTVNIGDNSTQYQASLDGEVTFKKYVPYAGIGYGRPIGTGLSLTFDLGVVFQGTPTATLTGTCTSTPPSACNTFQSDLKAQEASLNDAIKDFRYYPVVALGLAYTF